MHSRLFHVSKAFVIWGPALHLRPCWTESCSVRQTLSGDNEKGSLLRFKNPNPLVTIGLGCQPFVSQSIAPNSNL